MAKTDCITYEDGNGIMKIVNPAPELYDPNSYSYQVLTELGYDLTTEEGIIACLVATNPDIPVDYKVCKLNKLPASREFRLAWKFDDNTKGVKVDAVKKQSITRDNKDK